jgi:3-methylcrotonyl-CoA carboxylase beta subunit
MHSKNIAPQLRTNLDTKSEEYQKNKKVMLEKLDFIDDLLDQAELGGGTYHHERLAKRGKMPIRERIMNVIDDDSPFFRDQPFCRLWNRFYSWWRMCFRDRDSFRS